MPKNDNSQPYPNGFTKVNHALVNIHVILRKWTANGESVPEDVANLHIDMEVNSGRFAEHPLNYWRTCWKWSHERVKKLITHRQIIDNLSTSNRQAKPTETSTCDGESTSNRQIIDRSSTGIKEQEQEINLPISFLAEGIGMVKATCKELGPLPDNAKAVHQAIGNALKRKGMDVQWEVTVEDRGDGYRGRIDLVATWKGSSIGIEIDRLSPREKSIFKLLGSGCHGKVVVLRGAEAIDPPDGIDAVFSVQVQEEPELELGTPKPPPEPPKPDRKSTEFPIPEGIHLPAWKRWTEFRRTVKRKPVSYAAAVIQFKDLLPLTPEQQMEAVEHSIGGDYQKLVVPYSVRKEAERAKTDTGEPKMLNLITGRMG